MSGGSTSTPRAMSWTCMSGISDAASRPRASQSSSTPCAARATFSGWTREAPVPPRPSHPLVRGSAPGHPGRGQRAVLLGVALEPAPAGGRVARRRGADRPGDGRARRRRLRSRAGHPRAPRARLLRPVFPVPGSGGPVTLSLGPARKTTAEDRGRRLSRRGADDEIDHLADTLNAMLEGLEAAFAQSRRFSADAAHELRTPLTALKGEMEVALRAARSPEEYRRVLASSLEEVEHLIHLAEDLLVFSRSTPGLRAPTAPVDLEPLLLEVLETGARRAQGVGVTMRADTFEPATVLGDAGALRRAILNLVDNAIKYTPAGGKVELSLVTASGQALVTVRDTGIGFEPGAAARIFEPFVRLDAARGRDTGGTGLGLALVQSVVTAHGGAVEVESAPGAGSRFTIRLPLTSSK